MRVHPIVLFVALIASSAALQAAEPQAEADYKGTPWHLIDLWWDLGADAPLESYSIDAEISADVAAPHRLYISPVGLGHVGKTPFYGGIQTLLDGNTKRDTHLRTLGPGFIFSMWGQRSFDAIRPSIGGFCQSSGHEGDFVSVRRPYEWHKGKYTYKIVRMDKETVEGKPYTWIGVFVYSHEKDENVFVGALRFPEENPVLKGKVASFVEVYGPRIPLSEIPKVTVTYGNLRVNGQPVKIKEVSAIYPKKVPDYAAATWKDGSVTIEVGQPVENRKERRVKLYAEKP